MEGSQTPAGNELLDVYRWVTSDLAAGWLDEASRPSNASIVNLTALLREHLTAEQTHSVLEQVELRRRAAAKFTRPERMYFTRLGLEQATGQSIAEYKAGRFPANDTLADLCCGIGGDLVSLARRGAVVGVDRDPVAACLASANCRALGIGAKILCEDVRRIELESFSAWHVDPDRRPRGLRTTRVKLHEPSEETLDRMISRNENAAIKLAPAAAVCHEWSQRSELEWIGSQRECKQLVCWLGRLARYPGKHVATIFDNSSGRPHTVVGRPELPPQVAVRMGRYVFEPHSAFVAAGLTGTLAETHDLRALDPGIAYLTGDQPLIDTAMARFQVIDVVPLDIKKLRTWLKQRRIGVLEVKQRGVKHDLELLRRKLKLSGKDSATLILTRMDGREIAVLCKRMDTASG